MDHKALIVVLAIVCSLLPQALLGETTKTQEIHMKEIHQQLGIDLFNQSWEILLSEDRSREDEDKLLNMVHASLHHWRQIGSSLKLIWEPSIGLA